MDVHVQLVKAFSNDVTKGNPAGVIVDAGNLSDAQILSITRQLGFSESAFLQSSQTADYRLRLFSAKGEMNACMAAMLAAAFVVNHAQPSQKISFETKLGIRYVTPSADGILFMELPQVTFIPANVDRSTVASLLRIPTDRLLNYPLEIASVGTPKLLIPVASLADLFAIRPDLDGIAAYCTQIGARGFYPFTLETKKPESSFHARQFNPLDGIPEDPATGTAAVPLAAYLYTHGINTHDRLIGEQGYICNAPSEMILERRGNSTVIGGHAVFFGDTTVQIS